MATEREPLVEIRQQRKKWFRTEQVLFLLPVAIIVFAIIYFITSPSGYEGGITGRAALAMQRPMFWVFVVLGVLGGGYLMYLGIKTDREGIDNKSSKKATVLFIIGFLLMLVVWIPACNTKAETIRTPTVETP